MFCFCVTAPYVYVNTEPLSCSQDLVNIEMFLTAKEVEESLERQETATCLAWCHDNKSRLRKMKVVQDTEAFLKHRSEEEGFIEKKGVTWLRQSRG